LRFLAKVLNTKDFFQNSQFDQIHYLRPSFAVSFPSATPDWAESQWRASALTSEFEQATEGEQATERENQVLKWSGLNCVQRRSTNSEMQGAKNRAIAMLSNDVGGLKRTT
jgi:hypothetical protein